MERYLKFVVGHKKAVIGIYLLVTAFCVLFSLKTQVCFDWSAYLSEDTASVSARNVMEKEFGQELPDLEVQIRNVSVPEAREYAEALTEAEGVQQVLWLGDSVNIYEPLEYADEESLKSWYQNRTAVYQLVTSEEREAETVKEIRGIIGMNGTLSGSLAERVERQENYTREILSLALLMIPVLLFVLILAVRCWGGAVLAFLTILISVLIDGGTSVFGGEIYFLNLYAVLLFQIPFAAVCSLIVLRDFEQQMENQEKNRISVAVLDSGSMSLGKVEIGTLILSGIFLLTALLAKSMAAGALVGELCLALTKAALISGLLTVSLLPALLAAFGNWVKSTAHSIPEMQLNWLGKAVQKLRIPLILLLVIGLVISFRAQGLTSFSCGQTVSDMIVLLVPGGNGASGSAEKETALNAELNGLDGVDSVVSYINSVGMTSPAEYLSYEERSQYYSANYSRILIQMEEDADQSEVISAVRSVGEKYYGQQALLAGEAAECADLENGLAKDRTLFLNMGRILSYFQEESLFFAGSFAAELLLTAFGVGYTAVILVLYLQERKEAGRKKALRRCVKKGVGYLLVPTGLLTAECILMKLLSADQLVGELGSLAAGDVLAVFVTALFVLPGLLMTLDPLFGKVTAHTEHRRKGSGTNEKK